MIIVKVMGGLGNQMFQIAFARALSLELNEEIILDTSVYEKYKIRSFSLHNLKVSKKLYSLDEIKISESKKKYFKITQVIYHILQKLIKLISYEPLTFNIIYSILSKKGLYFNFGRNFTYVQHNTQFDKLLYGYFQSEKYFFKYKDQIKNDFIVDKTITKKESKVLKKIQNTNAVALSMRLDYDYSKNKIINVCTKKYYFKAIEYIMKHIENPVFFIFSDRIDLVKKSFDFNFDVNFIEGFSDYESLRLMYNCKHFIISNSSFSWWGAYLSSNLSKVIVAPNRWYNNHPKVVDIYLEEMVLIDV